MQTSGRYVGNYCLSRRAIKKTSSGATKYQNKYLSLLPERIGGKNKPCFSRVKLKIGLQIWQKRTFWEKFTIKCIFCLASMFLKNQSTGAIFPLWPSVTSMLMSGADRYDSADYWKFCLFACLFAREYDVNANKVSANVALWRLKCSRKKKGQNIHTCPSYVRTLRGCPVSTVSNSCRLQCLKREHNVSAYLPQTTD